MPPTALDIAKSDIEAYKTTLSNASQKQRDSNISVATAKEFNDLLKRIAEAVPEMAPNLPKPVLSESATKLLPVTAFKFTELELVVQRVLNLIVLYQKG